MAPAELTVAQLKQQQKERRKQEIETRVEGLKESVRNLDDIPLLELLEQLKAVPVPLLESAQEPTGPRARSLSVNRYTRTFRAQNGVVAIPATETKAETETATMCQLEKSQINERRKLIIQKRVLKERETDLSDGEELFELLDELRAVRSTMVAQRKMQCFVDWAGARETEGKSEALIDQLEALQCDQVNASSSLPVRGPSTERETPAPKTNLPETDLLEKLQKIQKERAETNNSAEKRRFDPERDAQALADQLAMVHASWKSTKSGPTGLRSKTKHTVSSAAKTVANVGRSVKSLIPSSKRFRLRSKPIRDV